MVGDILQPTHLLFILVVALLVLGPKRLPEVGRTLGSGIRDFRNAISGESSNPLHDWTHEVSQSSQPELRHEVPDEAGAEAATVSEPVAGDASFTGEDLTPAVSRATSAGTPTAPVVERPAVVPGTIAEAQPARPKTPITARQAGQPAPRPARPATVPGGADRPGASNGRPARPVRSGIPARTANPTAAPRPTGAPRPATGSSRPSVAEPRGAAPRPARAARPIPAGTRPAPAARPARPRPAPARPAASPARPASPASDGTDA